MPAQAASMAQDIDSISPTNLQSAHPFSPQSLSHIDYNTFSMDFTGLSDLDWLFQDAQDGNYFDDFLVNNDPQSHDTSSVSQSCQTWPGTSQEPAAKYLSPGDRQGDWPLDGAIPLDRRLEIPALGKNRSSAPDRTSLFRGIQISEDIRSKLQGTIGSLLGKPLWTAVSLANFPTKETLDHCIDLFFANFHPVSIPLHSTCVCLPTPDQTQ